MNLLTVFFQAPAAGPDGSLMWIMLIAMFVIMYFFMILQNRHVRRRTKMVLTTSMGIRKRAARWREKYCAVSNLIMAQPTGCAA